ncbi:PQQ-binding-like beta-propeller repeat protein [Candidatus Poribacteria bacterium]|nr:PQQ-binding-like beta-propeller repeat protein [Candidatus Poribacteria bacterium]MYB65709.1 PQQ-binding-like beta-propeller repeat protein [Candidatus Poribacteria bacterium]
MRCSRMISFTLLFLIISITNTYAQDYTQWALPKGAKYRFGKGKTANLEAYRTTIGKGRSYHFSPDSTQFSVMTSIGIWEYDVMTGKEIKLSRLKWNRVDPDSGVVMSPDSQMCAITRDNRIEVWNLLTNQLKNIIENPNDKSTFNRVHSVAFSPDGQTLASTSFSGIIRLWDIDSGNYSEIHTQNESVGRVMFSPDGRTLASSAKQGVELWDIETKRFKGTLEDTTGVNNIIFSPNGDVLFGLSKEDARFWDTNTGKIRLKLEIESSYRPPFALSPDGNTFAFSNRGDYTVQLWDTTTGQLKSKLTGDPQYVNLPGIANGVPQLVNYPTKTVDSLAFSPDGQTLAVASDGEIALWNPKTGEQDFIMTEEGNFYYMLFSPDGRTLATRKHTSLDETRFLLWNIDTTDIKKSKLRHVITGHFDEVTSLAFNSDGDVLASGYHLERIKLWDVEKGKHKTTCIGYPYQLWVQSLDFAPNGETIASLNIYSQSSFGKAEILLWDAMTGAFQKTIKAHGNAIGNTRRISHGGNALFSPDGKKLISGSLDGTIRLLNVDEKEKKSLVGLFQTGPLGKQRPILKGHTDQILTIALSPDGNTVVSGSSDKTIRVWDTNTLKIKFPLTGHTEEIWALAFTPDGLTLASGCRDGSIHLWDPLTGKHSRSVIGNGLFTRPPPLPRKDDDPPDVKTRHRSAVSALLFSHDGKTLVNGNSDGTIHFWDMNSLQIRTTLSGQSGLNSLTISPDGSTLASGGSDGTILIWDLLK